MAEKSTIARPYAKAAFEEARERNALAQWSQMLAIASTVVVDPQAKKILHNPRVTPAQLADLIVSVGGAVFDERGRNFISTVAASRRLEYLPEIALMYEAMRAEAENVMDIEVTSAIPLDDAQRQTLMAGLKQRFKREVRLHSQVDASLIGGAIIRAGDMVLDGSVKMRLDQLAAEMTH